jgi:hypothetical protein
MGKARNAYKILLSKPEERDQLRDIGIDWRIKLKWILNK